MEFLWAQPPRFQQCQIPTLSFENSATHDFTVNGRFALTGHMVQNPPYWMAKECGILYWDIENKGKSNFTGSNSFVFESVTFFCHPVWRILYHVIS